VRKAGADHWPSRRSVLGDLLQGAPLGLKRRVAAHPEWGHPQGVKLEGAFLAGATMSHSHVSLDESSVRAAGSRLRPGQLNGTRNWSALGVTGRNAATRCEPVSLHVSGSSPLVGSPSFSQFAGKSRRTVTARRGYQRQVSCRWDRSRSRPVRAMCRPPRRGL